MSVSPFRFYTELLYQLITGGNSSTDKPDPSNPLKEGYFFYSSNRIYTNTSIKKVFLISAIPRLIDYDFRQQLRSEVSSYAKIIFIDDVTPYNLDFTNQRVKARVRMWENRYEDTLNKVSQEKISEAILKNSSQQDIDENTVRMIESWQLIKQADEDKRKFGAVRFIFELVSDTEYRFMQAERLLKHRLHALKLKYRNTFLLTNEYYKSFSPVGRENKSLLHDKNPTHILPDYVWASSKLPTHGIVGDPYGVYMGSDRKTLLPITVNVNKDESAFNVGLFAETGNGKSTYIKGWTDGGLAEGLQVIINDYEGDEYNALASVHGGIVIDFAGKSKNSFYYDTVEIGDLTGDPEIDISLKINAIKATQETFDIICDAEHGMNSRELALFNDAIINAYAKFGVTDDPETWINSKPMTSHHVYREVLNFTNDQRYQRVYGDHLLAFIDKLRTYFEPGAMNSHMFSRRISLQDLIGNPLLVFSFGERGKTTVTKSSAGTLLKLHSFAYLTNLIVNYNRFVLGIKTVVDFEELQRSLERPGTAMLVADHVTGGRKRNEICFLASNAPLAILEKLTSSNTDIVRHTRAIMDNIQCLLLGALKPRTIKSIAEAFSIEDCVSELEVIAKSALGGPYQHCFLYNYRNESAILKMMIPQTLLDSDVIRTRTTESDMQPQQ